MRGVALGLYPTSALDAKTTSRWLDELVCLGANRVALVVSWAQDDVTSVSLKPDPTISVSDVILKRVIAEAHERGLDVTVFLS